ncbi:MAG: pilus assembly protein PilM [Deltaproteobacteria bacterium]|nr:pilus assembly protein PilM [Deltaproteobacteria bacterium]
MFAVDLGAWSVKLAIASPGIRGASLINVVERLVPQGDQPIEDRIRAALASVIDELKLRDEAGYIGVYGDQVFTQVLEFGFKHLRRSDLDKAVGGELEGVVPVDLEDMVYCFEQIPAAPAAVPEGVRGRIAPPAEGMRVLSYAMRRDRADQLIEVGKQAGFNARGLLACGGAAAKLVERTPSLMKARTDGAVAVIDIGHERTDVVVVHAGKAVFSRSVARAGKHVTQAIASHWRMAFGDAERAKHADGFVASQAEPATSEAWARIHQVTVTELAPFARDIRQTLAACRAKTGFSPLAAILVGGGARLRGIGSFLTEALGIPAWRLTADDVAALAGPRLAANAQNLPIDSAALTVGMAYDAAGGRPQFDLHSGSGGSIDFSFVRQKAVPLGVSVLAIAAFAAFSAYADLYRLKKSEKTLNTRLAQETTEMYGSARTASEVLNSTGAAGGGAAMSPVPKMTSYDLLLEINTHIPPKDKVTLDVDKLEIDNEKVDMSGTVKTPEELDALVSELRKSDCFKDIQRGPTDTLEGGIRKFRLTMPVKCM